MIFNRGVKAQVSLTSSMYYLLVCYNFAEMYSGEEKSVYHLHVWMNFRLYGIGRMEYNLLHLQYLYRTVIKFSKH